MDHFRLRRGGERRGGLVLVPLLGLAVACGPPAHVDIGVGDGGPASSGGAGGRGGSGGRSTGGTGGTIGTTGSGGSSGSGGVGGSGGSIVSGGSGGSGSIVSGGSGGASGSGGVAGGGGSGQMDATLPEDVNNPPNPPVDSMPDNPPPPPDMALPVDTAPASTLGMGLVGRWKLDENTGTMTADTGGNNNGTVSGAAWAAPGYPGAKYANPSSLRFDGNNDFVQLGGANGLPANNRPQSVSFWLNYAGAPAANGAVCVSLTDGQGGGSRLKLGFKDGRLAAFKGGSTPTMVSAAPPAAGWHHFAYTFDGNIHRLYIDGTQQNMSTVAPDTGAVNNARLGSNFDGNEPYAGLIDEVRIYNRPLSTTEVTALHDGFE